MAETDPTRKILDLKNRFTYHPPKDQATIETFAFIRDMGYELAKSIEAVVPAGRELSLSITAIEEAVMWANAGLARNQG
jgi:hypothetical protein